MSYFTNEKFCRSRSDATGLLSAGNPSTLSKYHELSGQLHQHLHQVENFCSCMLRIPNTGCGNLGWEHSKTGLLGAQIYNFHFLSGNRSESGLKKSSFQDLLA
jgi:hypothetical protein